MAKRAMKAYRSILMVGTHPDSTGGIRAVVRGYLEGGLFERFHVVYVATHRTGGFWTKARMAVSAWVQVAFRLATLDAPLVHVMLSSRASFWRKSVVCLLARAFRRPYLLHVHSGRFVEFYQSECTPAAQWLVRDTFSHAALVIALSEEWRTALLGICPAAPIEVLPNAVSLQEPAGAPAARRDDTLLFLGDVTHAKGIFDVVRALGRVAERSPRVRLVCGGLGAIDELRGLARELRVEERVICPGWLDSERKRAELAAATVFVLPSYAEAMPMALLEAMSYGLPVIASEVGSIPQVVRDGVNGLLVDPGDVEGLAAAVSRLLQDGALRASLGAAAHATIAAHFSLDTALARLATIYRRFGLEPRAAAMRP